MVAGGDAEKVVRTFVALTDQRWFRRLAADPSDEVDFWQPSAARAFRALSAGELFLFKLHAPQDFIVGGGVFSHASNVPLSLAWDAFDPKNGIDSLADMRRRIARYRHDGALPDPKHDPPVGCRILTSPFFWPQEAWLPAPASFSRAIVSGKRYGADEADGRYLWDAVTDRAQLALPSAAEPPRRGRPMLVHPRLGQGAFRIAVTVAIEVPHGPVVERLMERGFRVRSIDPKQLDRFRDRFSPAGAKDDSRDAPVLADALRTDPRCLRRLEPLDPIIVELRKWSRIGDDLRHDRDPLGNRVRELL